MAKTWISVYVFDVGRASTAWHTRGDKTLLLKSYNRNKYNTLSSLIVNDLKHVDLSNGSR